MMFAFHCPVSSLSLFLFFFLFFGWVGYVLNLGGRDIDTERCEYIVYQSRAEQSRAEQIHAASQLDCERILGGMWCGWSEWKGEGG